MVDRADGPRRPEHRERELRDDELMDVEGRGEHRWPMALAVVFLIVVPFVMPNRASVPARWILPVVEALLLVVLIAGDPGRINRRAPWLRTLSIGLIGLLALSAAGVTVVLIVDIVGGNPELESASALFRAGGLVWSSTIVAFALLFWELDSGGPAVRVRGAVPYPDFAFPQLVNPELAPPGWRPTFLDYLYTAYTNATAFSPTDVMPLSRWAKVAMAVQSLVSIALLTLVIARAVNIFN